MSIYFIVYTGLPCTGKTSLSEAISNILHIPVFSKDLIETRMAQNHNIDFDNPALTKTGYQILTDIAANMLASKTSLILDSAASKRETRIEWATLAHQNGAQFKLVHCICSDVQIHQQRVNNRPVKIVGRRKVSWQHVQYVKSYYMPPENEPNLTLDSIAPFEQNLQCNLEYISSDSAKK